jgi:DNA-binding response OmpR family regulator
LESKKILVIDDDVNLIKLMSYILKKANYEVITARNGREGITLSKEHNPSLIILDLMMPVMDGFKFLEEFKSTVNVNTPVIVMTARGYTKEIQKILNAGAVAYIEKPFDRNVFINTVNHYMITD